MSEVRRQRVLPVVDRVAAWTGVHALMRRKLAGSLTILMYHKVLPDSISHEHPLGNLVVRDSHFARQMAWLTRHAHVIPLGEALARQTQGRDAPKPLVAVTFDDGYRDNYEVAAPILEANGLRGTFFVTTGFVEGRPLWFDVAAAAHARLQSAPLTEVFGSSAPVGDLAPLLGWMKRQPADERNRLLSELVDRAGPPPDGLAYDPMSTDQVRQLHAAGHEVGSHTVNHPLLPGESDEALAVELEASRSALAAWTGEPPRGFCYPNGDADGRIERAVAAAGYEYACTTQRGVNPPGTDPLRLRRWMISETSTVSASGRHVDSMFAAEVLGLHGVLRRWAGSGR